MKKVGFYLTLTFISYLVGQLVWIFSFISDKPLFGSEFLETFIMVLFFTFSGIFGLISGLVLLNNFIEQQIKLIRNQVKEDKVIVGVSGGRNHHFLH